MSLFLSEQPKTFSRVTNEFFKNADTVAWEKTLDLSPKVPDQKNIPGVAKGVGAVFAVGVITCLVVGDGDLVQGAQELYERFIPDANDADGDAENRLGKKDIASNVVPENTEMASKSNGSKETTSSYEIHGDSWNEKYDDFVGMLEKVDKHSEVFGPIELSDARYFSDEIPPEILKSMEVLREAFLKNDLATLNEIEQALNIAYDNSETQDPSLTLNEIAKKWSNPFIRENTEELSQLVSFFVEKTNEIKALEIPTLKNREYLTPSIGIFYFPQTEMHWDWTDKHADKIRSVTTISIGLPTVYEGSDGKEIFLPDKGQLNYQKHEAHAHHRAPTYKEIVNSELGARIKLTVIQYERSSSNYPGVWATPSR